MPHSKGQGDIRRDDYPASVRIGQVLAYADECIQLPDHNCTSAHLIAHPRNIATLWLGFITGTACEDMGFPLPRDGQMLTLNSMDNLNHLYLRAEKDGDRLCYLLEVLE